VGKRRASFDVSATVGQRKNGRGPESGCDAGKALHLEMRVNGGCLKWAEASVGKVYIRAVSCQPKKGA